MAEGCDTAARRERAFLAGAAAGLFVVLTAPWLLIRVEFRDVKNTPWDCCVRGQVVEIWVLGRQIYHRYIRVKCSPGTSFAGSAGGWI